VKCLGTPNLKILCLKERTQKREEWEREKERERGRGNGEEL
jgi:hypothetical protein